MTQEETGNLIKYIKDNTWTDNSSPANQGYCKAATSSRQCDIN